MFKKLFLMLMISLSLHTSHSMQGGANAGLNPNPVLNFDTTEATLDSFDYLIESLKIGILGSSRPIQLRIVYVISTINKILMNFKELTKLDLREVFEFIESEKYKVRFTEEDKVESATQFFGSLLISIISSWWSGHIDSLGIFKLFSNCGYVIRDLIICVDATAIAEYAKKNTMRDLNKEKLKQFCWLSLNKLMPLAMYAIAQTYKSGFGKHVFYTLGDESSKKSSYLYRYCSLLAGISEIARIYRQAKFNNAHHFNAKSSPKTS